MAYLILDLDETAILYVQENTESIIHTNHELSSHCIEAVLGDSTVLIQLINPNELARLIEVAYEGDGVIVMTAGYWDISITDNIADYLVLNYNLNSEVANKFKNCFFLSPVTEAQFRHNMTNEYVHPELIRSTLKAHRFNWMLVAYSMQLSDKNFTFLDDNILHVESFHECNNVIAVWADTKSLSKDFYSEAMNYLRLQNQVEQQAAPILNHSSYSVGFFQVPHDSHSIASINSLDPFEDGDGEEDSINRLNSSAESACSGESSESEYSMNSSGSAKVYKMIN